LHALDFPRYRQIAKDGLAVCDLKPILKKYGFGDLPVYLNTGRKEENSEPLMSISSREYHLFYDERMTSLEMAITGNFKP